MPEMAGIERDKVKYRPCSSCCFWGIFGEGPQENFRLRLQNRISTEISCRRQLKKDISQHILRVYNHEVAER